MLWYSLEAPRRGASNEYHNICCRGASNAYPQHIFSSRNMKTIYLIPTLIKTYENDMNLRVTHLPHLPYFFFFFFFYVGVGGWGWGDLLTDKYGETCMLYCRSMPF